MKPAPLRNPKRAFYYVRVSTDHQDNSMDLQNSRMTGYAQLQSVHIKRTFEDEDVSGRKPLASRPGGAQLLEALRFDPEVGSVIILKLDRLGRKASDVMAMAELFEDMGVVLHIVDFGGDAISTQGAAGKLLLTIMAAVAEWEVETICDRITSVLDHKFANNEVIGTVPFGWDARGTGRFRTRPTGQVIEIRELVDNVLEQHWLREIKRLRDDGLPLKAITQWLNERGALTKSGVRGKWKFSTVNKLLHNKHSARFFANG